MSTGTNTPAPADCTSRIAWIWYSQGWLAYFENHHHDFDDKSWWYFKANSHLWRWN